VSEARGIAHLVDVVAQLRGPNGCPWDREQTLESLKPYLIEEAYELIDTIESGDVAHHREELGDVLLQVVLQAEIRRESGDFDFEDVAESIAEKLVRRHPHVFGDVSVSDSEDVVRRWEAIKLEERKAKGGAEDGGVASALEGIPRHLPALHKAQRMQQRASKVGFDWEDASGALAKVEEEIEEIREAIASGEQDEIRDEFGDIVFALVNVARFLGVHAEGALDRTNRKFSRRFREVERRIAAQYRLMSDCTLEELDREWDTIKQEERQAKA
jgi:tetrapyrrole methylase family protein/MazG family protein